MPANARGYFYHPVPIVSGLPPYPPELIHRSQELMSGTLDLVNGIPRARMLAAVVAAKYPAHAGQAKTAASQIGIDPLDLLTANLCYDLLLGMSGMGCSTLALAGPDGPILARNMDWFPEAKVARASCIVHEDFGVHAGFLGMIGVVTGLSKNGFCLCLNAAIGGSDRDAYPMLLFLRHVLNTASDFAIALAMVQSQRLMSSGIITIVGMHNHERAIVERLPGDARVRFPKHDEPLLATNHFRSVSHATACPRYEFMAANINKYAPLELLTHQEVLQDITAQHVVICPRQQILEMYVPAHLLHESYQESNGLLNQLGFLANG